jgi:hypothetical protein
MYRFMIAIVVQAKTHLKCWAVDLRTFEDRVLFSDKVKKLFETYASAEDAAGERLMTMDDFVKSCNDGINNDPVQVDYSIYYIVAYKLYAIVCIHIYQYVCFIYMHICVHVAFTVSNAHSLYKLLHLEILAVIC